MGSCIKAFLYLSYFNGHTPIEYLGVAFIRMVKKSRECLQRQWNNFGMYGQCFVQNFFFVCIEICNEYRFNTYLDTIFLVSTIVMQNAFAMPMLFFKIFWEVLCFFNLTIYVLTKAYFCFNRLLTWGRPVKKGKILFLITSETTVNIRTTFVFELIQ